MIIFHQIFVILLIASVGCSAKAIIYKPAFYDGKLPNLLANTEIVLEDFTGKTILMSFFAPDCKWCHKLVKLFNRIIRECHSELQPLSVDINGSAIELRKELRRAKVKCPAFKATSEVLAKVGGIPATPLTLLFGVNGDVIGSFRGYLTFKKIKEVFPDACPA